MFLLLWHCKAPNTIAMADESKCFIHGQILGDQIVTIVCENLDSSVLSQELKKVTVSFIYLFQDNKITHINSDLLEFYQQKPIIYFRRQLKRNT